MGKRCSPDDAEHIVDFERVLPMPETLREVSSPADKKAVLCYLTDGFKKPIDDDIAKVTLGLSRSYIARPLKDMRKELEELAKGLDPNEKVPLYFDIEKTAPMVTLYELGKRYVDNFKSYGYAEWYEWAINTWGCKWNASGSYWKDDETIIFDTPWCPPDGFYEELAKRYPELNAVVLCADEDYGNGCAVGYISGGKFGMHGFGLCSTEAYKLAIHLKGGWLPDEEDDDSEYGEAWKNQLPDNFPEEAEKTALRMRTEGYLPVWNGV